MAEPVPALTRFDVRTEDPELAHQRLRDAYVDFVVRFSGNTDHFVYRHSGAAVPGFAKARLRYTMTSELDAQVSQTAVFVNLCPGGHLAVASGRDRAVAGASRPVLMPPDESGWRVEMDDVTIDSVALDRATVDRAARSLFDADIPRIRFTSMEPVSDGAGRYWRSVVDHVEHSVLAHDEIAASPLVLADAERALATALLVTFPNTGLRSAEEPPGPERAEPAVLRRALAYIEEHAGEDIGVDDIAAAARVGVRGLQALFRRHRDRTPLDELRGVRMARAHADLQTADPTRGDRVAAIAARWGFTHPGRFSVQYRQRYGHPPGETLRS